MEAPSLRGVGRDEPHVRGEQRAFTFLLIKLCDLIGGVNADLLFSHLIDF